MIPFAKEYTISRYAPGEYNSSGIWVEGAASQITIHANIQPLKMEDMQVLPEGRRTGRAIKILSDEFLQAAQQATPQNGNITISPDVVPYIGTTWEIVGVEAFLNGVMDHYRGYAVEVKEAT